MGTYIITHKYKKKKGNNLSKIEGNQLEIEKKKIPILIGIGN